jgi:radical SAM protein with 4Fe4S-binding SPASM domain
MTYLQKKAGKDAEKLMLSGNKLIFHEDRLAAWKRGEISPPIFIEFGPASICNQRCIHCYVQDYTPAEPNRPRLMEKDVYLRFMGEIGDYGVKAVVLGGCGEPLLNKASTEAIETAVNHGTDVGLFSNGVPILEKNIPSLMANLTFMRLSVHGFSTDSYSKLHRCNPRDWNKLEQIVENIGKYKRKNDSKCTLGFYTLVYPENITELEDGVKWVKDSGFEYIIIKPPAQGLNKIKYVEQMKLSECQAVFDRISKLSDSAFKVQLREDLFGKECRKDYKKCMGLPFMCAVDADGSVYTCNWFWGNKDFAYGNLYDSTFKEIWEGKVKKRILEKISSDEFGLGSCGECRQDAINKDLWAWNEFSEIEMLEFAKKFRMGKTLPRHVNFL